MIYIVKNRLGSLTPQIAKSLDNLSLLTLTKLKGSADGALAADECQCATGKVSCVGAVCCFAAYKIK